MRGWGLSAGGLSGSAGKRTKDTNRPVRGGGGEALVVAGGVDHKMLWVEGADGAGKRPGAGWFGWLAGRLMVES